MDVIELKFKFSVLNVSFVTYFIDILRHDERFIITSDEDKYYKLLRDIDSGKNRKISKERTDEFNRYILDLNLEKLRITYTPKDYEYRNGCKLEIVYKYKTDDGHINIIDSLSYDYYPENLDKIAGLLSCFKKNMYKVSYFASRKPKDENALKVSEKRKERKQKEKEESEKLLKEEQARQEERIRKKLTKKDYPEKAFIFPEYHLNGSGEEIELEKSQKVTIVPVGSSSSGNSMYIRINDAGFVIDCGFSYMALKMKMNEAGFDDADAIFITHTHSDHISGVNSVCDNTGATMYGSIDTCRFLKSIVNKNVLEFYKRAEITKGLYVTMLKTSHDRNGSAGFIFEKDDVKIGYITDTGYLRDINLDYLKGSQIVVMESNHDETMLKNGDYPEYLQERILSNKGHLSNKQCADICYKLAKTGTFYFYLAHLSEENNTPEIALNETLRAIPGCYVETFPPYDGEIEEIDIEYRTDWHVSLCDEKVNDNSFVFYDFETSGLNSSFDCIIEIGAIKVINGVIKDNDGCKFQMLIKPYGGVTKIDDFIEDLTGITNEMLDKDGVDLNIAVDSFKKFVGDFKLVGFNSKCFDSKFLERACVLTDIQINNDQIDLIKYARKYKNEHGLSNARLTDMAEHFGIINKDAHRAYADALTTAKLYFELKRKMNF